MADKRLTDLSEILGINVADDDVLLIVDKSDVTDDPAGTSKKISVLELKEKLDIHFETISLIAGNDVSVEILTKSYLSAHATWSLLKVGQMVECSQQLARKTLTSWAIKAKNGLASVIVDLDNVDFYSGSAGSETLDISTINTADLIIIKNPDGLSKSIYNIVGGEEGRVYRYLAFDANATLVELKNTASPTSNCLSIGSDVGLELSGFATLIYLNSINMALKNIF